MEVGTCLISLPCRWYSAIIWPQDWFPWRPLGGTLRAPRGWNSDRPRRVSVATARQYIPSANVSNQRRSLDNIIQHQFHQGLPMVTWFIKFDSPQASTVHMQRNAGIVGISRSTPGPQNCGASGGMARIIQSDTQSARGETQKRIIHIILWQGVT